MKADNPFVFSRFSPRRRVLIPNPKPRDLRPQGVGDREAEDVPETTDKAMGIGTVRVEDGPQVCICY